MFHDFNREVRWAGDVVPLAAANAWHERQRDNDRKHDGCALHLALAIQPGKHSAQSRHPQQRDHELREPIRAARLRHLDLDLREIGLNAGEAFQDLGDITGGHSLDSSVPALGFFVVVLQPPHSTSSVATITGTPASSHAVDPHANVQTCEGSSSITSNSYALVLPM